MPLRLPYSYYTGKGYCDLAASAFGLLTFLVCFMLPPTYLILDSRSQFWIYSVVLLVFSTDGRASLFYRKCIARSIIILTNLIYQFRLCDFGFAIKQPFLFRLRYSVLGLAFWVYFGLLVLNQRWEDSFVICSVGTFRTLLGLDFSVGGKAMAMRFLLLIPLYPMLYSIFIISFFLNLKVRCACYQLAWMLIEQLRTRRGIMGRRVRLMVHRVRACLFTCNNSSYRHSWDII